MTATRLTMAGLLVAVIALVVGTTVIPTHVSFGAGSLQCGTVLHPETGDPIMSPHCGPAGAIHLRSTLWLSAILAVIALVPLIAHWMSPRRHLALWVTWGVVLVLAVVLGLARLGWAVEYSVP